MADAVRCAQDERDTWEQARRDGGLTGMVLPMHAELERALADARAALSDGMAELSVAFEQLEEVQLVAGLDSSDAQQALRCVTVRDGAEQHVIGAFNIHRAASGNLNVSDQTRDLARAVLEISGALPKEVRMLAFARVPTPVCLRRDGVHCAALR